MPKRRNSATEYGIFRQNNFFIFSKYSVEIIFFRKLIDAFDRGIGLMLIKIFRRNIPYSMAEFRLLSVTVKNIDFFIKNQDTT
jgi:hypothetical protein